MVCRCHRWSRSLGVFHLYSTLSYLFFFLFFFYMYIYSWRYFHCEYTKIVRICTGATYIFFYMIVQWAMGIYLAGSGSPTPIRYFAYLSFGLVCFGLVQHNKLPCPSPSHLRPILHSGQLSYNSIRQLHRNTIQNCFEKNNNKKLKYPWDSSHVTLWAPWYGGRDDEAAEIRHKHKIK